MKKALVFCLLMTALFFSHSVQAKILRVAYSGPAVAGVDYLDVQAAVNAAAADDTIQLYQNASSGGGGTSVSKRLVFLGFGYSLETNTGLQAVPSAPNIVTLYFLPGAENSKVQGVYGTFWLGTANIIISRCLGTVYLGYNANTGQVPIANATLVNSYLNINGNYGQVSNVLISNSIINSGSAVNLAGLFSNNIFLSIANAMQFGACVVKNNIFTINGYCPSGTSAVFQNNLFSGNCSSSFTGSNNQFSINMTNVFVNWNGGNFGSESNLALKAGSPAIGFGADGNGGPTDAGIYGGEAGLVYKPSGIPAIPAIYQLTSPGLNASTNPYTITVSVRSNN